MKTRLWIQITILMTALIVLAIKLTPNWQTVVSFSSLLGTKNSTPNTPTQTAAPLNDFKSDVMALIGTPRSYASTQEIALAVRKAIELGEFAKADNLVKNVLQQTQLQNGNFIPFSQFVKRIIPKGNTTLLNSLNTWIIQEKKSAIPYLLRSIYYNTYAWEKRGEGFSSEVKAKDFQVFQTHIGLALTDINTAIKLDSSNPYLQFYRLKNFAAFGDSPAMEIAFQEAIKIYPSYYQLYTIRLKRLLPKWGGSLEKMYAFVDTYAGKAPANSLLKLLYLELYRELLDMALFDCNVNDEIKAQCIGNGMQQLVTPALEEQIYNALKIYPAVDHYTYTMLVGDVLLEMIRTKGAERYANSLLQLTADATGSDIQLSAIHPEKNNFMWDYLAGYIWFRKQHNDDAEKMYQRAVAELQNVVFPTAEEKDKVLADIYDKLAALYDNEDNFEKVVIYQKAADLLGDKVRLPWSPLKCFALFKLKYYNEAIKDCGEQFENGAGIETVYWRAKSYEALGQVDAALQDYQLIANSDDKLKYSAAITISVIYAQRNDMAQMLKTLNTYTFLYDEVSAKAKDMAIAYNNRCYAKMQLGHLQEALEDCTASLRYDSLPDAYQKQQNLIRLLKLNSTDKPQ